MRSTRISVLCGLGAVLCGVLFAAGGFEAPLRPGDTWFVLLSRDTLWKWGALFAARLPGLPYSPLAVASLWIDSALWPSRAAAFYAFNLLLHGIACALLHRVVTTYDREEPSSGLLAAAFFAISPAVLPYLFSVPARGSILSVILLLLAALLYARPSLRGSVLLSLLCFGAALLACSRACLVAPGLLAVLALGGKRDRLPLALYATLWCAYLYVVLSAGALVDGFSARRLLSFLIPIPPTPPGQLLTETLLFLAMALPILIGLGIWCGRQRLWPAAVGLLWWAPAGYGADLSLPDPTGIGLAAGYLFVPGLVWCLARLTCSVLRSPSRQIRVFAGMLLALVAVSHLRISSTRLAVAYYYGEAINLRLDGILQQSGSGSGLRLVSCPDVIEYPYYSEALKFLDPMTQCRGVLPHLLSVSPGGFLWMSTPVPPGLTAYRSSGTNLLVVGEVDGRKVLGEAAPFFILAEPRWAWQIDVYMRRSFARKLGYRHPVWVDTLRDWHASDCTVSPVGSGIRVVSDRTDPWLASPPFRWPTAAVEKLRIEMVIEKRGAENYIRLYWDSSRRPGIHEFNSLDVPLPETAAGQVAIDVDLTRSFSWLLSDEVKGIRLDPPDGSILRINSVALLPAVVEAAPEQAPQVRPLWSPDEIVRLQSHSAQAEQPGCYLSVGDDPAVWGLTSLDPLRADALRITMRVTRSEPGGGPTEPAQIYWGTLKEPQFGERRRFDFTVFPDGLSHTYAIETVYNYRWLNAQKLTSIRIDPMQSEGSFCIEQVEVVGREAPK